MGASKELLIALKLLAQTSEFQAQIARASQSVVDLGSNSQEASEEATSGFEAAEEAAGGLAGKIQSAIDSVFAFATGFVAVQTAVDALDFADALNGANDNLAIAVNNSVDLANAQNLIFEAAQASSGELVGSTKLAATLFKSFETGGVVAEEALTRSTDLVRVINEGLALGGGAAEANQNALAQLVQGIQSGTFAGDELKSVLEQSPPLAEALAKGMGKSVGELKALGAAGKISGTDVINALEKSAADIDKNFETLGGNAGRGLQRGLNSVQLSLGALFHDNGIDAAVELALAEAGTGIATFIDQSRALFTDFTSALKNLFGDDQIFAGLGDSATEVFGYISRGVFGIVGGARDAFSLFIASGDLAFITVKELFQSYVDANIIGFKNIQLRYFQVWDVLVATAEAGYRKIKTLGGLLGDDTPQTPKVSPRIAELQAELKVLGTAFVARQALADQQKDLALAEIQYTLEHGYSVERIIKADTKRSTSHTALTAKIIAETKSQAEAAKEVAKAEQQRVRAVIEASNLQFQAFNEEQNAAENLTRISEDLAAQVGGPSAAANLEYARTMLEIQQAFAAVQAGGPATAEQIQQVTDAQIAAQTRLSNKLAEIAQNDPINRAAQEQANEFVRIWQQGGSAASDQFAESLLNGFDDGLGSSLRDIWKRAIKQMLSAQIEQSFFQPFIAQLQGAFGGVGGAGGGITGLLSGLFGGGSSGGLGSIIGSIFGGGSAPAAGGGLGSILGTISGTLSGSLGGILQSVGGFFSQGGLFQSGILGSLGNFGSSIASLGARISGQGLTSFAGVPVVGWIAAAMALNQNLFKQGWRANGGTLTLPDGQNVRGGSGSNGLGNALTLGAVTGLDRLFQGLGLSGSTASLLSGSAIHARLFGRKAPELTGQTGNFTFGQDGASGTNIFSILEKGGFFRSDRRSTQSGGLSEDQTSVIQAAQQAAEAAGRAAAAAVATAFTGVITAEFTRQLDKDGKLVKESGRALGAEYAVTFEEFARVIAAETAIDQLPDVASDIAQQFRGSVDAIVDASDFLVAAQSLIVRNMGLFDGEDALQNSFDIVDKLGKDGETLLQTYQRLTASTALYDETLRLAGQVSLQARDAVIEFASGIVDAAGGLDAAASLYQRFFDVAYSEQERGLAQLAAAEQQRNALLTAASLSGDTTLADVRAAIEELMRTGGDPARVVLLLQIADAIATVDEVTQSIAANLPDASEALRELASTFNQVAEFALELDARFTQLARSGFTDFQRGLLSINDQLQQDVAQLQQTRNELVKRGATTEQLAAIDRQLARAHQFAAAAALQAISQLRAQGRALIAQLRGGRASPVDDAQSFANAGTQAFEDIGQAAQQAYATQLAGIKSLQEYLDAQLLGDTSSLTNEQRLAEALAQFQAAVAAAPNDPDALRRLTQLADIILRQGRAFDPSDFPALEAQIRAALQSVIDAGPNVAPTVGPAGFSGTGSTGNPTDNGAEEFAASQAELSLQIAEIIRQLIGATQDSLGEVAAQLGFNISELVAGIGISLTDLTAGSVQSLGSLANSLGVELVELADEVGISLGSLADAQSLLNDALEAEIAALPLSQREQLQPLLDAVEASADNPAGLVIAQAALEAAIADIGGQAAANLAPYFDNIDPIDPLLSIDAVLRGGFDDVVTAINNIGLLPASQPEGSFAVGTSYVPRDMLANIHQGEAVIDADSMRVLRQYGVRVVSPLASGDGVASTAVISELRQLRAEVQTLRATVARGDDRNVLATVGAAELQSAASDRIARAQTPGRRVMS